MNDHKRGREGERVGVFVRGRGERIKNETVRKYLEVAREGWREGRR